MQVHLRMLLNEGLFLHLPLVGALELWMANCLKQVARRFRMREQPLIGPMSRKPVTAFRYHHDRAPRTHQLRCRSHALYALIEILVQRITRHYW